MEENNSIIDSNELASFLERYNKLSEELKSILSQTGIEEIRHQNDTLRDHNSQLKSAVGSLQNKIEKLAEENRRLKTEVDTRLTAEREIALKASGERLNAYLEAQSSQLRQRLFTLEEILTVKISNLYREADYDLNIAQSDLISEFNRLETEVRNRLNILKSNQKRQGEEVNGQINDAFANERAIPVSTEDIRFAENRSYAVSNSNTENISGTKNILNAENKSSKENKLGLRWFSWAGVILVLLGIITFASYTYSVWLSPIGKTIGLFSVSVIFLAAGEVFIRRRLRLFAEAIISLGLGSLYASAFLSYFVLNVLSQPAALGISVGISALAVVLTRLHKSKTITVFTLIGGYLPVLVYHFTIQTSIIASIVLIAYILLLNAAVVTSSTYKEWGVVKYLAFSFGMLIYLLTTDISGSTTVNLVYSLLIFLMFTFIQLAFPIRQKVAGFVSGDIIILGLNTVITATACYCTFKSSSLLTHYTGLFSLAYAAIYLAIGIIFSRARADEKDLPWLFYIASLTFFVLTVPFQFNFSWLSLGWVAQGTVILLFGIKSKKKILEYYGWCVFLLSFLIFGFSSLDRLFDAGISPHQHCEMFSFFAISIILLAVYHTPDVQSKLKSWEQVILKAFKYFTVFYFIAYIIKESYYLYSLVPGANAYAYIYAAFVSAVLLLFSAGLVKIKRIRDEVTVVLSYAFRFIFIFVTVIYNLAYFVFPYNAGNRLGAMIVSFAIMLLMNAIAFTVFYKAFLRLLSTDEKPNEIIVMLTGFLLVLQCLTFIPRQFYWFRYSGFILNFVLMVLAFLFIAYGFGKRYVYIKRVGLGLSLFVCAKLFFIDLFFLDTLGKIISFIVIGLISLAISYSYQRIGKQLESGTPENTDNKDT